MIEFICGLIIGSLIASTAIGLWLKPKMIEFHAVMVEMQNKVREIDS